MGAAVAIVCVATACGSDGRLERAESLLTDDDRFTTGTESALTFGRVTSIVRADADDCAADNSDDDPRCAARFEASAWLQLTALALDKCTRADRDDARESAR